MQIKTLIGITILMSLTTNGLQAGEQAAAFLNIPVGAREAALGGAGVSLVNDAAAVYWNPARLGGLKQFNAATSMLSINIGGNGNLEAIQSKHYFAAAAIPLGPVGTLGIGWQHYAIGDIEHIDENRVSLGFFDDSENAFYLAYGYPIVADRMCVGLNVKYVRQQFTVLSGASAQGFGFSLGMTYQLHPMLGLALRMDDDFALKWENGTHDQVPFKGMAGLALRLWDDMLTLGLDLEQVWNRPLKAGSGLEFNYAPAFLQANPKTGIGKLSLRAGVDDFYLEDRGADFEFQQQLNFNYGFGMVFLLGGVQCNLDYTFGSYRIGSQNRFGASIFF
ncbi:hypothetical protein L0128_16250 [candidate division KSB1 bacterium]|nr:hypothetical protein [candidate division KSB1 bacterium]